MHIVMKCPCGASLKAPVKYVGRELKCPKCGTNLIVPEPPTAAPSQPVHAQLIEDDPFALPAPQSQPLPPATSQPVYRKPGSQKKTKSKPGRKTSVPLIAAVATVAVLVFAGIMWFVWQSAASDLSANRGGIRVKGKDVDLNMLESRVNKPADIPRVEASSNKFDSGSGSFGANANQMSETEMSTQEIFKLVNKSMVRIKVKLRDGRESIGSGFFIDNEGKVVTNYHVIRGAAEVVVTTADNKSAKSPGYIVHDKGRDLAILQVNPADFEITPIFIASQIPEPGEQVVAIGSPQGFGFSVTEGIVSGIRSGTEIDATLKEMNYSAEYRNKGYNLDTKWIQSSAAISGGNSGGPLVNLRGELVGVNTWTHRGGQNLNFASAFTEITKVFQSRGEKLNPYLQVYR